MSVPVFLTLFAVVVTLIYRFITRNTDYWKKRGVLGPKPQFFFGNLKDVILHRAVISEYYHEFYSKYSNQKVVGAFRLTTPVLVIRDLDLIQHIMIKDFDNFVDRGSQEFGNHGLSQNLVMTNGDNWRVLRTRLSPIFSSGKIKNMFHLIEKSGEHFLEHIGPILEMSPEQKTYSLIQKYTIATISACVFGLDINLNDYDVETYAKIDKLIFTPTYFIEISFLFPGIMKYLNIPIFPEVIRKFFYNLIETITKERNGKPSNRNDFMDLMLELKNAGEIKGPKKREDDEERTLKITDDLLAAQAFIFYAAGYETTATTVSLLLHELAFHQDIQNRVVNEINEVLGRNDNKLTYDSLKEMTYLSQVFDEVLRMYPIIDPLQRRPKAPFKVPGTDITIEKDVLCQISVFGIHYDEKYYPNPYDFDPERFTPENVKSRHPCAYMPFGVGSRNCIGMRFAKVQSGVCAVKLLRRYRVERAAATTRHFIYDGNRVIMGPKNGIPLKFVPRNGA